QKMDLVLQPHQIDAGLEVELSDIDADPALDVPRRLRLQIECRNDEYERTAGTNPFVGIGQTKCARGAGKDRKRIAETVLKPQMRRPLPLALVERGDFRIVAETSKGIVDGTIRVMRIGRVFLDAPTDRNVGVRPNCCRVHGIEAERSLLDVLFVDRHQGSTSRSVWTVFRVVEVDACQQPVRQTEQLM